MTTILLGKNRLTPDRILEADHLMLVEVFSHNDSI
jgi:hypothetical protein